LDFPTCTSHASDSNAAPEGSVQSHRLLKLYARATESILQQQSRSSSIKAEHLVDRLSALARQHTLTAINRQTFSLTTASDHDQYNYDGTLSYPGNLTYDPCQLNYASAYLSSKDVQEAMHVSRASRNSSSPLKWLSCNDVINQDWFIMDFISDVTNLYSDIYNHPSKPKHFKMLVYSGDSDGVCATIGTQHWIYGIEHASVTSLWKPWRVDGQQAGFVTQFNDSLSFATVHFAGHEVPAYQPERALALLTAFLDSSLFNTSSNEVESSSFISSTDLSTVLIAMAVVIGLVLLLVVIARSLDLSTMKRHSPTGNGNLYEMVARSQHSQR
jgi:hypothetical protein